MPDNMIVLPPTTQQLLDERRSIWGSMDDSLADADRLRSLQKQRVSNQTVLQLPPLVDEALPIEEIKATLHQAESLSAEITRTELQIQQNEAEIDRLNKQRVTLITIGIVIGVILLLMIINGLR